MWVLYALPQVAVAKGSASISKLFQYIEKCENKQIRCDFYHIISFHMIFSLIITPKYLMPC